MIYIVHGDDIVKSRALIVNQQKKLNIEKRFEYDISDITPSALYEHLHAASMFGDSLFIVVNISKAGNKNMEPYIKTMENLPENTILIILSDKSLSSANAFIKNAIKLKAIIKTSVKPEESNVFSLIDAVLSKNRKKSYSELSKLYKDNIDDYEIFSKFLWGLRNLALIKFEAPSSFKMNPYVKNKTSLAAKAFSKEDIKNIYDYFYAIDKKVKTGELQSNMMVTLAVEKMLNS